MNIAAILAAVSAGLMIIRQLVEIGVDTADLVKAIEALNSKVKQIVEEQREPSEAEWADLNATLKALTDKLNTDPPVAQPEAEPATELPQAVS